MSNWQVMLAVAAMTTATVAIFGALAAFARWTGKVDASVSNFSEFMTEIRADIKQILQRLPAPAVSGASPLKLTELVEEMAASMQAKSWAGGIAPGLLPHVINKQPFEVDEFAQDYVSDSDRLGTEMDRRVSACAYEFGRKRDGVLNVLHVVLRDELLRLRRRDQP